MAEPTLKDVLAAIARLEKGQTSLEKGQTSLEKGQGEIRSEVGEIRSEMGEIRSEMGEIRSEMATKADLAAFRDEMNQRFDDLDAELTKHAEVHRELEKDITNLKRRPPRTAARPARRGR